MSAPYDVLFGRKTYDIFAAHATADHPMHHANKYVATSHPETLTWHKSTPIMGYIAAEVARLQQQDGPLLQVHGSCELIQLLLCENLVDELRLCTFPVVVGNGKSLFGRGTIPTDFEHLKTQSIANGVLMSIYQCIV